MNILEKLINLVKGLTTQTYNFNNDPQSTPIATPTPMPDVRSEDVLNRIISEGLANSNFADAPIATLSGELARAGSLMPEPVDPLLPTIMSLIETSGGRNMSADNNLFNLGPGVTYPDVKNSILGGGDRNQQGFLGTLREGGPYQNFRESGNLSDFFSKYTPSSDPRNPNNEELLKRYEILRSIFE